MITCIILNGGSSSGKTSIARALQNRLPGHWLRFSIDDLIDAMPSSMLESSDGVGIGSDGAVWPGAAFRRLESAWMHGIAAMIHGGAPVIIDEVFLTGTEGRQRWEGVLANFAVLWVGVHCDAEVAAQREQRRPDRVRGMAERQAAAVHVGMTYDVAVDTTHRSAEDCARSIVQRIAADYSASLPAIAELCPMTASNGLTMNLGRCQRYWVDTRG